MYKLELYPIHGTAPFRLHIGNRTPLAINTAISSEPLKIATSADGILRERCPKYKE
jgi:hypothetical protein